MSLKKKIFILTMIIFNFLNIVGCGTKEAITKVEEVDKEPYLNFLLDEDPKSLDPCKSKDTYSNQVLVDVNEGLTRLEKDSNGKEIAKPAGSEKWEVSQDGLKWTFHLRNNKWSDGKPVTAHDYEYGIKRSLDAKVASKDAMLLYSIKGAKDYNKNNLSEESFGVKAINDKTLEINLERPCAYFINLTYLSVMYPQRKDIVEKFKDKYGTDNNSIVFSGPFIVKKWINESRIELIKNENYWDRQSVKLKKLNFKIVKNNDLKLNSLIKGEVDCSIVTEASLTEKLNKTDKFNINTVFKPSVNFECFNQKNKLFSNVKIRKAFTLAVNREDLCKNIWKGMYKPAYAWVSPAIHIGSDSFREKAQVEPIKKLKEENKSAKKLLLEGLGEIGLEQDPSKYTVCYLQPSNDVRQKEIAEFFKSMYCKNLGINIRLEYVNPEEFKEKINKGEYDMASSVWLSDYDDPLSSLEMFISSVNLFSTGWSDIKYDELVKEAYFKAADKNNERFQKLKSAEYKLLNEEAVVSPTVWKNKQIYSHKYVKGIMNSTFGPEMELKYSYTQGR